MPLPTKLKEPQTFLAGSPHAAGRALDAQVLRRQFVSALAAQFKFTAMSNPTALSLWDETGELFKVREFAHADLANAAKRRRRLTGR